jgi:hypothetical protein
MKRWEDNSEHNREMMIDSIQSKREDRGQEPTQYAAPERDQKWHARELFGFMWRHLGIKIPQGYRDVMLFVIEKANADNGRFDWRQHKIANVLGLGRQYVNEALQWWATETPYLKMKRRKNRDGWFISNAYQVRWKKTDAAWAAIRANTDLMNPDFIHVGSDTTTDVASDTTTDVASDTTTRNTKGKGKGENHPKGALQPSAVDATPISPLYENQLLESQITTSPPVESQKGFQEEKEAPASANQSSLDPDRPKYTAAAQARLTRALCARPALYDAVTPELEDKALIAETDSPGSGIALILKEMCQ